MKNIRKMLVILIVGTLLMGTVPVSAVTDISNFQIFENNRMNLPGNAEEYAPDEIIVKFKQGVSENKIRTINSGYGTSVLYTSPYAGFKRLLIPNSKSVSEMVAIYSRNPNVDYAEPNFLAHALMVPNDLYYPYQWHLNNSEYGGINMEDAWDVSTGKNADGNGTIVAVLDTGVAYENFGNYIIAPDLANTCFTPGYDFVNIDAHPNDDNSHGTHVAGTIAQSTNNNVGVAGVAFDACIMPVKVLDNLGSGTYSMIADGIYYAANNGALIISMSLGGPSPSATLEVALAYAHEAGVTIIASSCNGGPETIGYPAGYDDYVIAVGATRYDETRASYSSYYSNTNNPVIRQYVDITAPGGDMEVDQNRDGYGDGVLQNTFNPNTRNPTDFNYWFFQGTSMAAPHVSGVAALLIANGVTGPDNVREVLESTAEDHGDVGWDPEYGYGIVDAHAALLSIVELDEPVLTTIDVSPDSATLYIGDTQQFTATGKDQYENTIDTGTITWESTNTLVGTIDEEGNFTAVGAGTTTINATNGTVTGTASVTVMEASTNTMSIANITMWYSEAGRNNFIYTKVTIRDSGEAPVPEAMVSIDMTLPDTSHAAGSGYTYSDGTVTFKLKSTQTGIYTSTVTEVTHTDLTWDGISIDESIEVV